MGKLGALLKASRLKKGLSVADASRHVGIPMNSYYDLEEYDGDLRMTVTLRSVIRLSNLLEIKEKDLFTETKGTLCIESAEELFRLVANSIELSGADEFKDRVGYDLANSLGSVSNALDNWNMGLLDLICSAVGVSPIAAFGAFKRSIDSKKGLNAQEEVRPQAFFLVTDPPAMSSQRG